MNSGGKAIAQDNPAYTGISVQTSAQGVTIPVIFGKTRVSNNMLDWLNFIATPHTEQYAGGKGGGSVPGNTTFTYTVSAILALGFGPIFGIGKVWKDKGIYQLGTVLVPGDPIIINVVDEQWTIPATPYQVTVAHADEWVPYMLFDPHPFGVTPGVKDAAGNDMTKVDSAPTTGQYSVAAGAYTFAAADTGLIVYITYDYSHIPLVADSSGLNATLYKGTSTQNADPWLLGFSPTHALNYRDIAYIINSAWDLGTSNNMPQLSFEVAGLLCTTDTTDVNPADVIIDYLTNTVYGVGFPSAGLSALTTFRSYCQVLGFNISVAFDSQSSANQQISDIVTSLNCGFRVSQGVIDIIPHGDTEITANGATYTPPVPECDLFDDNFRPSEGEPPVVIVRKRPADCYNVVSVECLDRNNDYNVCVPTPASDLSWSRMYGERPLSPITAHWFCDPAAAAQSANLRLRREHIRNTFKFKLGWEYIGLDVEDLVTITDATLGLSAQWARITSIEEDGEYKLSFEAEEVLVGSGYSPNYNYQVGLGAHPDQNAIPALCYTPVIFEGPTSWNGQSRLIELCMGVCGGSDWGGANVWLSIDGASFKMIDTIRTPARIGELTAALPAHSSPDTTNTMSVQLYKQAQQLLSCSTTEWPAQATLSWVDGEIVAYKTATLVSAGAYNLTSIYRGMHKTQIAAHAAGGKFMRLDDAVFKYKVHPQHIGSTFSIKLQSFNIHGKGLQDLDAVPVHEYTITGTGILNSVETGSVSVPIGGCNVEYGVYFANAPHLTWSTVTLSAVDMVTITNQTADGFHVAITNGGSGVSRNFQWTATQIRAGYGGSFGDIYGTT
jgi:hypothetical protein